MMKAITVTRTTTGELAMTETHAAVPRTLKELREAAGMTQVQVGERMGTNRQRISHIEARYPAIRFDVLVRYVQALDGHIRLDVADLQINLDEISADESLVATRTYLKEAASARGVAQMNLKRSAAKELVLQTGETEPGDDDTGGQVDHADAQGDQGDRGQGEKA